MDASADQNIPNRRPLRDKSDGSTLVVAGCSDVKAAPALLFLRGRLGGCSIWAKLENTGVFENTDLGNP